MNRKANFMAAQFGGAFEMWSPERLVIETITERRGNADWMALRSSREDGFEEVIAMVEETQDIVARALRTGLLTAYLNIVTTGLFYVIPAQIWGDPDCDDNNGYEAVAYIQEGRLFRGALDDDYAKSIPAQFFDTPIMIPETGARDWLRSSTVKTLSRQLPPQIPYDDLMSWLEGLGVEGRVALTNSQLLQAASAQFPSYHAGRRVIEQRRTLDGLRDSGRPTKSAEKFAAG